MATETKLSNRFVRGGFLFSKENTIGRHESTSLELFGVIYANYQPIQLWNEEVRDFMAREREEASFEVKL
ncbi:MAG: hypothetical protein ABIT47_02110 [Candidatus Paceibacterota bacterium]